MAFALNARQDISATAAGNVYPITRGDPVGSTMAVMINLSDSQAYVRFGTSSVTASVNGMPIPPNSSVEMHVPTDATHLAAVTKSGTAEIEISYGRDR